METTITYKADIGRLKTLLDSLATAAQGIGDYIDDIERGDALIIGTEESSSPKVITSEIGKDFTGGKLNEDNVHGNQFVIHNKEFFITGNRRGYAVELKNRYGEFLRTVSTEEICLVKIL